MRSKKAAKNILTNLFLQLIVIFYGFIVPKIIISLFGSSVNGLVSSIARFLGYIALLESGFGPVVKATLYKPIANKDKHTIEKILKSSEKFFKTIALIFIAYILVLLIVYPTIIGNEFETTYTVSLIIIISISTFAEYYFGMTYRIYLMANQDNYASYIIQIATYLLTIVAIIVCAKLNCSIHMIKLLSGMVFTLRPIVQNYYVKKKYNINLKNVESGYKIKQKWDGMAQHIASVIHNNTDVTVITIFINLAEVSVYSVYYLVVKAVNNLVSSFTSGIDSLFGDMLVKKEYNNLNKIFDLYEIVYFSIACVFYSCSILLIVPFVEIYTRGITDVNYIRYSFGCLIVISEYIWAIRLPYSSLILGGGYFKQTRKGAWVEAISNIVISVLLVKRFGIIGVAIGTIIAMTIRTVEFIYYTNKKLLKRNIFKSIEKILLVAAQTLIIVLIFKYIPFNSTLTYLNWIIRAIITVVVSIIVVIVTNNIFYHNEMKNILYIITKSLKRQ